MPVLARLRRFRTRPDADLSLGFLQKQFKRDVARPHQQLQRIVPAWREHVPAALLDRTRLDGYQRGVLNVSVASPAHKYELDRLLRTGLQNDLTRAVLPLTIRRVRIAIDPTLVKDRPDR